MPAPPLLTLAAGVVCTGAGLVFFGEWLRTLQRARASRQWPMAWGVVEVSLLEREVDDGDEYWRPRIVYRYRANGRELRGDCIAPGAEEPYSGRRFAQGFLDRYPVGKSVVVRYDPLLPERSLLQPGLRWQTFVPLASAAALLLFGGSILLH